MNDNRRMPARLSAFVIWALVAAGLVFWGLRLGVRPLRVPVNTRTVSENVQTQGDLSRLLGAGPQVLADTPTPSADSNRFRLFGVVAPRPAPAGAKRSLAGVALIAVDGHPPRPYAVGSSLDSHWVLQSITRRSALIGPAQGTATVVLELPPPAAPATGTLPNLEPGSSPLVPPAHTEPEQPSARRMDVPSRAEVQPSDD